MHWHARQIGIAPTRRPGPAEPRIDKLAAGQEPEVLAFLSENVTRTFGIVGFIRNNGLQSPHNPGTFYGCRNEYGQLEGVAIIGRFVLFEARYESAIEAFARIALQHSHIHMVLGPQDSVWSFWSYYAVGGQKPRRFCRQSLFELRWPVEVRQPVPGLRLATLEDLDLIVPSHARSAMEESGIDPLEVDPSGFRDRCRRRIEQGHTWVWVENGKLIFKTEVMTDSPDVTYLEGVEVSPEQRSKGYGLRCVAQLSMTLLRRTASVCLLASHRNNAAQSFYRTVGYKLIGNYDSIFLQENTKGGR